MLVIKIYQIIDTGGKRINVLAIQISGAPENNLRLVGLDIPECRCHVLGWAIPTGKEFNLVLIIRFERLKDKKIFLKRYTLRRYGSDELKNISLAEYIQIADELVFDKTIS